MNILFLGGTRFFGVHAVEYLLEEDHIVTIGTRGLTKDRYGERVSRIIVNRSDQESMKKAFENKHYDVVIDNLSYCSNDVKFLMDSVAMGRYIMTSSMSVYKNLGENTMESGFDPMAHPLEWCSYADYTYDEVKRQAESALFQKYHAIPSVAVRFPYVVGEDDYTKRLHFYVEHVMKEMPMSIDNLGSRLGFVSSQEAGKFLGWLASQSCTGAMNGASSGSILLKEIIDYIEKQTGKNAIISEGADRGPYNGTPSYTISTEKANAAGFQFSAIQDWIYTLVDKIIASIE